MMQKNTQQDGKISDIDGKLVKAVAGSKDGLMSKEDKTKLDGIAANANNYVLPAAGSSIGGVKKGNNAVANVDQLMPQRLVECTLKQK